MIPRTSTKKSAPSAVGGLEHQRHSPKRLDRLRRADICSGHVDERTRSSAHQLNGGGLSAQESQPKRRQRAESSWCFGLVFAAKIFAATSDTSGSPRAISLFHKSLSVPNLAGMFEFFAGGVKGFAVFRPRTTRANVESSVLSWESQEFLRHPGGSRIVQLFFLNSNASCLAATPILSPGLNSPSSSLMESGSSSFSWMTRLSGRAPNC